MSADKYSPNGLEGALQGRDKLNFFERFFKLDRHVAEDWVRCSWNVNPYVLACLRLLFLTNMLLAVSRSLYRAFQLPTAIDTVKYFFKLTHLSNLALLMYFALMTLLSFRHARDRTHWDSLRRFVVNALHFSAWMFQIVIPPIYWIPLRGYENNHTVVAWWQDVSMHGLGLVFLVIELVMVKRWYACWQDGVVSVGMMVSYMFWMWIAAALIMETVTVAGVSVQRHWWPYSIYRFGSKLAPVFYVGTVILCVVVSAMVVGLHKLKNRQS